MTVAFTLPGGVPVYAFSLLVGAGASLGFWRLITGVSQEIRGQAVAAGFALMLIGLAGARLVYQFNHPAAAVEIPFGGLSWGGALLSGWASLPLISRATGIPAGRLADAVYPLPAAVLTSAWLGCWVDGCAYGPPTDAWFGLAARDDWGNLTVRFPLQFLGACLALLTLVGADFIRTKTAKPGLTAGLWLTATGLQFWWLQSLRVDPSPFWLGFPLNLWAAGVTGLLGILLVLKSFRTRLKA
ncbi:MAG TPA: prolipoprotein diacylglyceryl transferase family protein [Anaerolineales bacterium]|nr:prolipoprotein diacylglyceryl transferase family protein [Anaerolineales bacterium]